MVSLHFLISTLELLHLKAIYKPNAANASAYRFSLLETCFILNVQNFSSILWANVLYDAKLGSFKEKLPLAWHLRMLPKLQKHSLHSEYVWVVFGYKSPLNGYNNGRGKEKRL